MRSLKQLVATVVCDTDDLCHRLHRSPRWLCDAAEIIYGVPPDCFGDPRQPVEERARPGRFAMLIHKWLY